MFFRSSSALVDVPSDLTRVESFGPEDDPADCGVTRKDVESIWDAARSAYRAGVYPALTLCIRRRGHTVLQRGIGHLRGNEPGAGPEVERVPIRYDSPFCVFSASKAITAMVIHHLDERGLIRLDDRVCEYIPAFARNGKRWVTIRHVLTHRAGIPTVPGEHADLDVVADWDRVVELLCDAKAVSRAGRRLSYHAITGGFILGEVVRQVTGQRIEDYLAEWILRPIGLGGMNYGVAPEHLHTVAHNTFTGPPIPGMISPIIRRALGIPFEMACEVSNDPRYLCSVVPSGNVVANAWQCARFYEMLLNGGELDGVRVFDERTIRRATLESSYLEMDFTIGLPLRYGMGLMLGDEPVGLFGPKTRHAYGHLGFINVFTWADPDRDISVALLTSGKPFISTHWISVYRLLSRIGRHMPLHERVSWPA